VLFETKIRDIRFQLEYVEAELQRLATITDEPRRSRIMWFSRRMVALRQQLDDTAIKASHYHPAEKPALDTLPQINTRLSDIAATVQFVRTREIPQHLMADDDTQFFENVLAALHREIGLGSISPGVSLYQGNWFGYVESNPRYALYQLPASLKTNLTEIILIYHEIGHPLTTLWGNTLLDPINAVVQTTVERKLDELVNISGAQQRQNYQLYTVQQMIKIPDELEELMCDAVGVLLAGPAYAIQLHLVLWTIGEAWFERADTTYPPHNIRLRLTQQVLQRHGWDTSATEQVLEDQRRFEQRFRSGEPKTQRWFYDEQYLDEIIAAIEDVLQDRGVQLYDPADSSSLRARLCQGPLLLFSDPDQHKVWQSETMQHLRHQFSSPK